VALLELKDISFTYPGSSKLVLNDVSLGLETGQLKVLIGKNGSGKSTLSRIAAGLLKPTAGSVEIKGIPTDVKGINVGIVFQNPDEQLLTADVESEIAWGLENLNIPLDEMKERVQITLEMFELSKLSTQSPDSLSDGWKQITALASVVAMKPAFLILDEVTAFLDPYWTDRIKGIVKELSKQIGVLWVTASTAEERWGAEIVILQDGC